MTTATLNTASHKTRVQLPVQVSRTLCPEPHYKRDWTARKPFYILSQAREYGPGISLVIVNERKLITSNPIDDLITSLEEQIATLKEMKRASSSTS